VGERRSEAASRFRISYNPCSYLRGVSGEAKGSKILHFLSAFHISIAFLASVRLCRSTVSPLNLTVYFVLALMLLERKYSPFLSCLSSIFGWCASLCPLSNSPVLVTFELAV
jgi:hypothetical protein